ncbi:MAG: hypothetical protein WDZ38_01335 [Balneolaceae bacterium]
MTKKEWLFILFGIFVCAGMSSCDNSLNPIDVETGIYSIYGFLDLNEEIHYIRVRDLNAPFTKEATESIDATVSLQNLSRGFTAILESRVRDHEGVNLHTFVYNNEIIPNDSYQLAVVRSDGFAVKRSITTPTKPEPSVGPVNQNCYVPIDFEMEPLFGSTIVLQVGIRLDNDEEEKKYLWTPPKVFSVGNDHSPGKITFTFIPKDQLIEMLHFFSNVQCDEYIINEIIYINYIHFGPGFYEQITTKSFDILDTQRFGALYFDTLAIPIDTTPVCPQDC